MAYQLIFRFILPIYRTTREVRRGFRTMQNEMNGQPTNHASSKTSTQRHNKPVGDYIEFEEVKDK